MLRHKLINSDTQSVFYRRSHGVDEEVLGHDRLEFDYDSVLDVDAYSSQVATHDGLSSWGHLLDLLKDNLTDARTKDC